MRNSSVSPGRESVHSRRTVPDLESGLCSDGSKADSASHAGTDSKGIPRWCRNSVPFLLACAIAAGLVYAALRFSPPDVRISASFGNGSGIVQPSSPSNGSDDTNDTRANVTTWVWTPPQAEPVCDRSQGCRGFEGWGSALAWNSIDLAGLDDGVKAEFMDAVWNRTNGLGLNVVRYSLAGGENPDPRHYRNSNVSHFQRNALLPGFQPSEGVWDWDADRGQRWMLTEAIKRGANLFEMVSSGPPYWMTVSNCSSGAVEPRNNNLRDDMYDAYADYLVEVVRFFRDEPTLNVTFRSLAPLNEPTGSWWIMGNRQEGIFFDNESQQRLLVAVGKALRAKGLNRTILTGSDDFDVWTTIDQIQYYTDEVFSYIGHLTTHSYGDGSARPREQLAAMAASKKKPISQSEYGCCLPSPVVPLSELGNGLVVARQILLDLVSLNAVSWIIWQPTWSFIDLGSDRITLRKSYYCFLHFTRYIRPGATIIQSNDVDTLAATSRDNKNLVLVIVNDVGSALEKSYDLRAFQLGQGNVTSANYTLYRTNSTHDFANWTVSFSVGKKLAVSVPAGSVSTLVFDIEPATYGGKL